MLLHRLVRTATAELAAFHVLQQYLLTVLLSKSLILNTGILKARLHMRHPLKLHPIGITECTYRIM